MFKNTRYENTFLYLFGVIIAFIIYNLLVSNIKTTLIPHISAIKLLYQMRFEFIPEIGYRETGGLFIIGESCTGARLFACLFIILTVCRIDKYSGFLKKSAYLLLFCIEAVLLAYIITVFRITASIPFCNMENFHLIHTVFSLMVYFSSGLGLYTFLNRRSRKGKNYK